MIRGTYVRSTAPRFEISGANYCIFLRETPRKGRATIPFPLPSANFRSGRDRSLDWGPHSQTCCTMCFCLRVSSGRQCTCTSRAPRARSSVPTWGNDVSSGLSWQLDSVRLTRRARRASLPLVVVTTYSTVASAACASLLTDPPHRTEPLRSTLTPSLHPGSPHLHVPHPRHCAAPRL